MTTINRAFPGILREEAAVRFVVGEVVAG